tara:strand:+ start:608 stop:1204 length:597 start_codon:yes stop_codon:yes gene_type:complete
MKIKRVVQMVSATTDTGRLASDMYNLDEKEYYSEAQAEHIPIADMDFQHLVRAFVKQLAKEKTNHCDTVDVIKAKDSIINGLRSQVETLQEQLEEKDQEYMKYTAILERQKDMYKSMANEVHRLNGHYYTFSEIPQDEEGKEFIKNCKKYLNKESYTIRVRGQHLKKDLYGQGRAYHGANMEDSSHMRVYIDKKRGDE